MANLTFFIVDNVTPMTDGKSLVDILSNTKAVFHPGSMSQIHSHDVPEAMIKLRPDDYRIFFPMANAVGAYNKIIEHATQNPTNTVNQMIILGILYARIS